MRCKHDAGAAAVDTAAVMVADATRPSGLSECLPAIAVGARRAAFRPPFFNVVEVRAANVPQGRHKNVVNTVYGLGAGRLPMPALQNVVNDWPVALATGVCLLLVVVFIATTMRKVSRLQADLKQLSEVV
jgi:hypothetical protein